MRICQSKLVGADSDAMCEDLCTVLTGNMLFDNRSGHPEDCEGGWPNCAAPVRAIRVDKKLTADRRYVGCSSDNQAGRFLFTDDAKKAIL